MERLLPYVPLLSAALLACAWLCCLSLWAFAERRKLRLFALWRTDRATLAGLLALAAASTIFAQKPGRGDGPKSDAGDDARQTAGDEEPGGVRSDAFSATNLCFAGISVSSNGVELSLAWPQGFVAAGSTIDLFSSTTLVDAVWGWIAEHPVGSSETNWVLSVAATPPPAPSARFFFASVRSAPGDLRDTDGDTIPDVYEVHNGTNPYVPDYALVPKLSVGPSGDYADIASALADSGAYAVVELEPSAMHDAGGSLGIRLPGHPVMICSPPGSHAVVRATGLVAFLLDDDGASQAFFRGLYVLLDAQSGFQTGFWMGGNVPMSGVPVSAAFEDVHVRMPHPGVEYFGWRFYSGGSDAAVLSRCTVDAAGSDWAYGVSAYDSPPLVLDRCSFVNFPPNGPRASCGVLLQTSPGLGGGADVSVMRTLFDESFTDAVMFGRLENGASNMLAVADCIVPRALPPVYAPDSTAGLIVTNAALASCGFPRTDSPSVALGVGAHMPLSPDPLADADGDGFCDYDEVYAHGTDPWLADTDLDGISDPDEVSQGTDPADPHSFIQNLTVVVTNTAAACPAYVAWGCSSAGWETNGLAAFPSGAGSLVYTNALAQGATHVKAFCDLDGDGAFAPDVDILFAKPIPPHSVATVSFSFGDVDGDGVSDAQERADETNPFDDMNFRLFVDVEFMPCDAVSWLTNYVAWGYAADGWETNGLTSFVGTSLLFTVDELVTNGTLYAKAFRDVNTNGVYDAEFDELASLRLWRGNNGRTVACRIGDANSNELSDWWEIREGLDAAGVNNRAYADPDGDGLVNLHEFWAGTHPLVPDGSNTLLSVAARSIDDRIEAIDTSVDLPRFTDYFANGENGVFLANTNFWARDLDLSCVSVWHSGDNPGSMSATLITRKHVVMARHWWNHNNDYVFCDTNGVVVTNSVIDYKNISDDLTIGRLDAALPDTFRPASVMPTNYVDYISSGRYLPTLCLNQNKCATVLELEKLNCSTTDRYGNHYSQYGMNSYTNHVSMQRSLVRGATLDGNSGSPVFLVVGNELVLLFSKHLGILEQDTWSPFWGPMVTLHLEAIQHQINEWEGADANLYQIVPFDFSTFDEIENKQ